jgi:hypothetical protein
VNPNCSDPGVDCFERKGHYHDPINAPQIAEVAIQKGASSGVVRSFWERGIPARWQLKLLAHFAGEAITIFDWANGETAFLERPPTLAELCRKRFLTRGPGLPVSRVDAIPSSAEKEPF